MELSRSGAGILWGAEALVVIQQVWTEVAVLRSLVCTWQLLFPLRQDSAVSSEMLL